MKKTKPTFGSQVMGFNSNLRFKGKLPEGIEVLNPFRDNPEVIPIAGQFYNKFYNDSEPRNLILGINPGRLGSGATGIPFTDTKRLTEYCGIELTSIHTHEPSSVFVYKVIEAFGGPEAFYKQFYISSICPLGFVKVQNGKEVNYNYYDSSALRKAVVPFVTQSLAEQLKFGIQRKKVICFGTGKNYDFISELNDQLQIFGEVIALEHPRYIMQYKAKRMEEFVDKYLRVMSEC